MEGKLIDLSPNSRLFLVYQNAILVNESVYTEKRNGQFILQFALISIKF
ncbi:hypothetical protein LEP1GSC074_2895 [Leptospira noguchii str. Hook]|nr:hypothetical protein LEP1GSC072_3232 [Leptospira noguchii str. Bonito]EMO26453.1 hypothetical protein LEP1GSC170_2378 [Leptospira interrogans serovar Bataviae str. HAI135]EMS83346.1 hypothetical protein LEP1GSC074_2895 [Leptospira noguchii str. Hook]